MPAERGAPGPRPGRVVAVVGTGTEVGKTWVAARVLECLRAAGVAVAARKPAQSFGADEDPAATDAAVLGRASAEPAATVCPAHRWYPVAMAPPMAAAALGRPAFTLADLVAELTWPAAGAELGVVETAGGVRSPLADDGDCAGYLRLVAPDALLLVADAELGTINAVRLARDALEGLPEPVIVLNRFDPNDGVHAANRTWLEGRDGAAVVALPGDEGALCARVARGS